MTGIPGECLVLTPRDNDLTPGTWTRAWRSLLISIVRDVSRWALDTGNVACSE